MTALDHLNPAHLAFPDYGVNTPYKQLAGHLPRQGKMQVLGRFISSFRHLIPPSAHLPPEEGSTETTRFIYSIFNEHHDSHALVVVRTHLFGI